MSRWTYLKIGGSYMNELIEEVKLKIKELFGEDTEFVLDIDEDNYYHLFIQTKRSHWKARDLLKKFDEEYWIDKLVETQADMTVHLGYDY